MMLYKKDCNYAFDFDKSPYCVQFFVNGKQIQENFFDEVDNCFLWSGYQLFVDSNYKFAWDTLKITDTEGKTAYELHQESELLEYMWQTLTDIPVDEDVCLEMPWFVFGKGTYNEDIWHWFDERYPGGVYTLLYH